jgi:hypothetical protein
MLALRVYGRTLFGPRRGSFRLFELRKAVELFAANAEFLGAIGGA